MIPALATALLLAAAPDPVGTEPKAADSPWAVQEVVVRAPAPRLWKLSRGGSTVYVLGSIEPLKRDLVWNKAQLERIMAKANRFIIEPRAYTNFAGTVQVSSQSFQPLRSHLDPELPDDLRERLHALLIRLGQSPEAENQRKAAYAAVDLNFRFRRSKFVTANEPLDTVTALAKRNHVPIEEAGHYDMTPVLKEITTVPESDGIVLLAKAVDAAEYQLAHIDDISAAWAAGDLHALTVARGKGPDATPLALFKQGAVVAQSAMTSRAGHDIVAAMEEALAKPGVSVTILDIRAFAAKGGAIDKLRAAGVEVTEPPD